MLEKRPKNRPMFTIFGCSQCRGQFEVSSLFLKKGVTPKRCPFCDSSAEYESTKGPIEDDSIGGRIRRYIEKLLEEKPKFHGSVQANFSIGGLTNVNVTESVKGKDVG